MDGVFEGVRVLDLTEGFAGALCTMVLGDNGAAVTRLVSSDPDDRHTDEDLAGARQWHRSKRIVSFDARSADGRAMCATLVSEADVLVVTARGAHELDEMGLFPERLLSDHPALIHCSIDGYGNHPELRSLAPHEGVVQAAAGRMQDYGRTFDLGRPAFCAPPLAGFGAAQGALQGICAALHVRRTTGRGQRIRTSLLKGLLPYDLGAWITAQFADATATRPTSHPYLPYVPARTKDGAWIQFANWAPHLFWGQAEALGLGHLRNDPSFAGLPGPVTEDVAHSFWEQVLRATAERTADDWMTTLTGLGKLGADVIRSTSDGMDHPQARFNGDVIAVEDELGSSEQIGPLVHIAGETPPIGVHDWAAAAGFQPGRESGRAAPQGGPLSDLIVLEAAGMVAVPLGPAMLSDLGARVIKIEPIEGDPGRALGLAEMKMIQGKESIAVNLKSPAGIEIVRRLVERADFFVHNYRPGVPERLGIDFASLHAVNPRLVYLYAGAYGAAGPYAKMPAYHPIAGAICGNAARQSGEGAFDDALDLDMEELKERSLRIFRANEGHPDMVTGCVIATSLLLGLMGRELDGKGRDMTTTMLASNAYLMSDDWIRYPGRPPRRTVDRELLGTGALNRLYETASGWIFLGVPTQREWRVLASLFGPDLDEDPRFTTTEARATNDAELAEVLAARFRARTADEWEQAGMARELGLVRADRWSFGEFEQASAEAGWRELTRRTESPDIGPHWRQAEMVEMVGTGGDLGGGCLNGQHTRAILAELGYDEEQTQQLLDSGAALAAT